MNARDRAFERAGGAFGEYAAVKAAAKRDPSTDNLTALNLAAFNLAQAEQDVADWQADEDWCRNG